MAEYIKREAAVKAVKDYAHMVIDKGRKSLDIVDDTLNIVARIEKIPAADVAPVVHGHWIWHEEEFEYECSACHCRFDYNHMFELFDHGFQYANWCPNCGAKMDGGADND